MIDRGETPVILNVRPPNLRPEDGVIPGARFAHPADGKAFERNQNFGRLEATTTTRFCARCDNCYFAGEAHPDPPWDGPRGPMPPPVSPRRQKRFD
jgi:hypothetical protein